MNVIILHVKRRSEKKKKDKLIGAIIALILLAGMSLGIWMCLAMIVCWVFGLTFSAKVVFGTWLIVILIRSIL